MSKPTQLQEWPQSLSVPYRAVIERMVDGLAVHVIVSLELVELLLQGTKCIIDDPSLDSLQIHRLVRPCT
jgi:hypothetical protein